MPQMAPMSWLILYIFYILMFILMIIINYYSFLYMPKSFKNNKITKKITTWKW